MNQSSELLKNRKFFPLFVTQMVGALNDNLLRGAVALYISYFLFDDVKQANFWTGISTAMFLLPSLLLSAISGELADKFKKVYILRAVKFVEIIIVLFTGYLLLTNQATALSLVSCVFLMGAHSAVFGPAKFAYLPEYLESDELLAANGLIESSTFAMIAVGAALSGLIGYGIYGTVTITSLLIFFSLIGWLASLAIPPNKPQNPSLKLSKNIILSTQEKIDYCSHQPQLWLPILGITWFWIIGMIHMTNLANYVQYTLHYNTLVVSLLNGIFTIGIAFGSLLCNKILRGKVHARYVPFSLLLVGIFGLDLYFASYSVFNGQELGSLLDFLSHQHNFRLMLDLLCMSIFAGLYVVPLYAIIQKRSPQAECAQVIATSNIVTSVVMICVTLVSVFLLSVLKLTLPQLFLLTAIFNVGLSMFLFKILPFSSLKPVLSRLIKKLFKVEIQGLEHFVTASNKLIVIANHVSFLDVIFLALFLPGEFIFAVDTGIAKRWFVKFAKQFVEAYEIDPTNPIRIKSIAKKIQEGKRCIIFPEGRLTNTGGLMKVYDGTAALAQISHADLISVNLSGLQFSKFSRLKDVYKLRFFTKVKLTISPKFRLSTSEGLGAKEQRAQHVDQIYRALVDGQYCGDTRLPLYQTLLESAKNHGYRHQVVEDFSRKTLNYRNIILKSQILGGFIHKLTEKEHYVGVLLPNTLACVVTLFSLWAYKKAPAMLNYTGGAKNLANSCVTSQIKTVITSRQFISKAELTTELQAIKAEVPQIIFLEDLAKQITLKDKLKGLWRLLYIHRYYQKHSQYVPAIDTPAAILFTSGSEGSPKGVVLSHRNIISNIQQSTAVMDLNPTDKMFNALPMFHAFGFNLGTITPILAGIPIFLYPNPKHFSTVVEMIYDTRATLLIGTNTFLAAYLKCSKNYDFSNLRLVFAGGEKLQSETRLGWLEQRGIRLLEGYGTTECGPVVSCNTPMYLKNGSVGKVLPGIETRYNPFPDLENGGELCVRGENIMLGYLYHDNPGKIMPLPNGWYDTGDIVSYDQDGFITIQDRIKRFAKISGEMVSLSSIENEIAICWPDYMHGVVSLNDQKRGEKLILITDKPDADRSELAKKLKSQGISPIAIPSQIQVIKQLPLLGTGKVDYPSLIAFIKGIQKSTKNFLTKKEKDT